ncbi:mitochondrial import inner membrane translocase subunit Tim9-like [Chrysoperla carnea]|uniref:mitochondrial import inner membrane translocase subunit Tim9-like n=1 Tax=Chrysoperla carnea TaxID=189513 RepID=UPI001D091725|nr:mitochondrial import inner membrane translocase subunit Tim9-like [Chrysoperla carnea]
MPEKNTPAGSYDTLETSQIKNFKDFLISYNKLSELCFVDCISDFTSRNVKPEEERCAVNCAEKFLKANQRISERFQEFQIISSENSIANAQKQGMIPRS